jgi:hypothetical protein
VSKFHIEAIRSKIVSDYAAEHENPELDEVNNLSRYLAYYAVDLTLGEASSASQRLLEITDGGKDRGIDAIGLNLTTKVLVFSQAKWRQDGKGTLGVAETLRFLEGVRSLVGMKSNAEPVHATEELRTAVQDLLGTPSARIRLVTVTTGKEALPVEASQLINTFLDEMNDLEGVDPIASHTHLGQAELFNSLTAKPHLSVDLDANLLDWGATTEPLRIYYGRLSGAEIAHWHKTNGDDLFAENIRVVIPRSDINAGILQTIQEEPEHFGYYNNGITVLASRIEVAPGGQLSKDIAHMRLVDASIVNGAQTVSTLSSVLGTASEANLGQVFVLTRCIEVPSDDPTLARGITRYANTQNEVSSQDFAFLDDEQHRLGRELRTFGVEYLIRQSEVATSEDPDRVVHVRDAAVGLACEAADIALAVYAKREVSRLFTRGREYPLLFNKDTDPLVLYRSVQVVRRVDAALEKLKKGSQGVELGVAIHSRLVVAHIALNAIDKSKLRDPLFDFGAHLQTVEKEALEDVKDLINAFPEGSYPATLFKNRVRTVELLNAAGLA